MDSDEEDFVFYGTPIEREEEITSRKKKAVAEASGQLRTLPVWKQEVLDEEGRRRFHGAFTGGFSAGYYNSVGSKEGWTPQAFTSSRKNRAEFKQQNIINFLDEDEKTELEGKSLGTSMQFDTFGFTAAELARKEAEKEEKHRPSAIPGPAPDEIFLPSSNSIGVKLLLKMGWRRGYSISDARASSLYDARREARKAFLALSSDDARAPPSGSDPVEGVTEEVLGISVDNDNHFSKSTPVCVLNPKQDLHGLGFDPFKHAPEFREKKRSRLSGDRELRHKKLKDNLFGFKSERIAPGFGIGALEDLDAEDEDIYASGYGFADSYVQEVEEPSTLAIENKKHIENKKQSSAREHGVLAGFKDASESDYHLERFAPPIIPKNFVPHHEFPASDGENEVVDVSQPEVPPPEDNYLKLLIEGVATLVARCGRLFEDLSREKNHANPLFSFLSGGNGQEYYSRKLWEERQKCNGNVKHQWDAKKNSSVPKMTAESRGKILGEKPLEKNSKDSNTSVTSAEAANSQFSLSDTFTVPASFTGVPEVAKLYGDDPEKQQRFEQFLKEKYRGGLRSKDSGGASTMSEAARARERLEFESAAEALREGKLGKETTNLNEISSTSGLHFTSGGLEQVKVSQAEDLLMKKMYPRREEFQWRPSPILCKRFDIIDPYMGKPPPAPRARSKMDSFIFVPDSIKAPSAEEISIINRDFSVLPSVSKEKSKDVADESELEVEVPVENVERPVDLYKAIFSDDDSDDDEENFSLKQLDDPQKKNEAANTTLNRLIAGDFLESLGKELGLEVPPDVPCSENEPGNKVTQKDIVNVSKANDNTLPVENKSSLMPTGNFMNQDDEIAQDDEYCKKPEFVDGDSYQSGGKTRESDPEGKSVKNNSNAVQEHSKARSPIGRHQSWKSSSSDDGRSRKRSRYHQRRSRDSSSNSSYSGSRTKRKKKGSGRDKHRSGKHTKHDKHRRRDSPVRSSHRSSEKEHRESKREKRKGKD